MRAVKVATCDLPGETGKHMSPLLFSGQDHNTIARRRRLRRAMCQTAQGTVLLPPSRTDPPSRLVGGFSEIDILVYQDTGTPFLLEANASPADGDDVALVQQAIQDGQGGRRVAEDHIPFADRPIVGDAQTEAGFMHLPQTK